MSDDDFEEPRGGAQATAQRKRHQVARACQGCARGKRKCSGTFPCARCVRLGCTATCIEVVRKRIQTAATILAELDWPDAAEPAQAAAASAAPVRSATRPLSACAPVAGQGLAACPMPVREPALAAHVDQEVALTTASESDLAGIELLLQASGPPSVAVTTLSEAASDAESRPASRSSRKWSDLSVRADPGTGTAEVDSFDGLPCSLPGKPSTFSRGLAFVLSACDLAVVAARCGGSFEEPPASASSPSTRDSIDCKEGTLIATRFGNI